MLNSLEQYTDQIASALDACAIYADGPCDSSHISSEFKHRPYSKEVHEQIETSVYLYVCLHAACAHGEMKGMSIISKGFEILFQLHPYFKGEMDKNALGL
jgi:hypothetical protein